MIGVVAILKVQDGKGAEFEGVFRELAAKVRAQEPGNLFYQLTKSRTEPDTYKVLELYDDQDALTDHGGDGPFPRAGPQDGGVHGRPPRRGIPRRRGIGSRNDVVPRAPFRAVSVRPRRQLQAERTLTYRRAWASQCHAEQEKSSDRARSPPPEDGPES